MGSQMSQTTSLTTRISLMGNYILVSIADAVILVTKFRVIFYVEGLTFFDTNK